MMPVALTIAGSDPSGGAGLQADLKTFHQFGVYGMSVVTLLTVQNTRMLKEVEIVSAATVRAQLDVVLDDMPCQAAKTGALGAAAVIETIADRARDFDFPLVVDPVMVSQHGTRLMETSALEVFKSRLLSLAALVTPNLAEARELTGFEVQDVESMKKAARALVDLGAKAVLVKGGHLEGDEAVDVLYAQGREEVFRASRLHTLHTHGTGCTYSAAITAHLAKGLDLWEAVSAAKKFISIAIANSPGLGAGSGPLGVIPAEAGIS